MRDTLLRMLPTLTWRLTGVGAVVGLALLSGQFVETAAQNRHQARLSLFLPQEITPLSASAESRDLHTAPEPARAGLTGCTPALRLVPRDGAVLSVTLDAPCAAETRVQISHGGMSFAARIPTGRPLHVLIPALEASGRVSVALPDGTALTAVAPVDGLQDLRRFAVTWQGGARVRLQPGETGATAQGWIAELGDATLDSPALAAVFTYPAAGKAEPMLDVAATPQSCGQRVLGQTITSRMGRAEATALSVDLPECAAGDAVMHLKNLDQETKIALR